MNKKDLTSKVAKQTGMSVADTAKSIDAVFQFIRESVSAGNSLTIKGFGGFSIGSRVPRKGFNPATKQPMQIAARKVMKFKPSKCIEIN